MNESKQRRTQKSDVTKMSDAGSVESAPPPANGSAVPAAQHQQHPLWQRMAQNGHAQSQSGANGKKRNNGHANNNATAGSLVGKGSHAPISMLELEIRARNEFDGASSVAESVDGRRRQKRQRHAAGLRREDFADGDAPNDDDRDNNGLEDDDDNPPQLNRRSGGTNAVNAAAFGCGGGGDDESDVCRPHNGCRAMSALSDSEDAQSVASSEMRDAHKRAFPISGVTCVGCALPGKVVPVDDFVRASCDKMQELALFKMAALIYQQKVAEPAHREGLHVPAWPYASIARWNHDAFASRLRGY